MSDTKVSLTDEAGVRRIVADTVFRLWESVNDLSRLQPTRRERYRVTIFGSARTKPGHFVYDEVRRMAGELAAEGCDIVTGGGPGLMQAANEGASERGDAERAQSVGIRVDLPFEQQVNPYVDASYEHRSFFTRLQHFVLLSDAFIVAPGGIGTVLEASMIWQLLQVRHLDDVPLVFAGPMWREWVEWARKSMLRPGFELVSPGDLKIPHCVDTADEAVAIVKEHHAKWKARGGA